MLVKWPNECYFWSGDGTDRSTRAQSYSVLSRTRFCDGSQCYSELIARVAALINVVLKKEYCEDV
jgi:hypothetical protein